MLKLLSKISILLLLLFINAADSNVINLESFRELRKTDENLACDEYVKGNLNPNSFLEINLPRDSNQYPNNMDCKWLIEIPENYYLKIIIKWIDLEFYQVDRKLERHKYRNDRKRQKIINFHQNFQKFDQKPQNFH